MTIALETEIVASRYDAKKRACFYTISRNGKRWTTEIAQADLDKHRGKRDLRRQAVGKRLTSAMNGPPDAPLGSESDPQRPATWADFEKLPSGQWYINPADGKLLRKP